MHILKRNQSRYYFQIFLVDPLSRVEFYLRYPTLSEIGTSG